jgi:hypothetical protein
LPGPLSIRNAYVAGIIVKMWDNTLIILNYVGAVLKMSTDRAKYGCLPEFAARRKKN